MILNKHVSFWGLLSIYVVVLFITFDQFEYSFLILSILIVGLGGWLYGIRKGYLVMSIIVLINTLVLSIVSGHFYDIIQAWNPIALNLGIILVLITGTIRESKDKLDELQESLESRITEATKELSLLAAQLIENDEQDRIQIGQDLHDGVGQYLTGLLLHNDSLVLKLRMENREEAVVAEQITYKIQENIQTVRKLSRSLLPIQFIETNLDIALREMVAYFNETSNVTFTVQYHEVDSELPASTIQHLYRILHEAMCQIIFNSKSASIEIDVKISHNDFYILIKGQSTMHNLNTPFDLISTVMTYRAKAIASSLTFQTHSNNTFQLECSSLPSEIL